MLGKYVPHDCSPESYNSFPPSQLYQHEKDGIVQHVPIARRDRFGKESKCPVSSGFEVQHETLLTDFNKMFKKMRQGDNGSEDSADVDLRRYAWPSSEQKSNQDFKNPRRHKSVTCAGFPSKIRQSVGLQGLKACILSDEAPEELHVEGKVCKLNPSVERGKYRSYLDNSISLYFSFFHLPSLIFIAGVWQALAKNFLWYPSHMIGNDDTFGARPVAQM